MTDIHEDCDSDDAWHEAPPIPLRGHGVAVVALEGPMCAIGGAWRQGLWSVTAWFDRTFVYDPDGTGPAES